MTSSRSERDHRYNTSEKGKARNRRMDRKRLTDPKRRMQRRDTTMRRTTKRRQGRIEANEASLEALLGALLSTAPPEADRPPLGA